MKNTFKIFCAVATVAALACSCTKEITGTNENESAANYLSVGFGATRTTIDSDFKTYWSEGDEVFLLDSDGNTTFNIVAQEYAGTAKAIFDISDLSATAEAYVAAYPAGISSYSSEDRDLHVCMPDVTNGKFCNAQFAAGLTDSIANPIILNNLSSIISFETSDPDFEGATLLGLTKGTDKFNIASSVYGNNLYGMYIDLDTVDQTADSLHINASGAGKYYFGFLPTESLTGLILRIYNGGEVSDIAINKEFTFTSGKMLSLGNIDARIGKNYKVVAMDSFTTVSGDLDEDGNFTYEAFKGQAATDPGVYSNCIRLYQASSGKEYGGYLEIKSVGGDKIKGVKIGIANNTSVCCTLDDEAFDASESYDVTAADGIALSGLNASKVTVWCTGSDKNSRLNVASIEVTYEVDARESQALSFPEESYDAVIGETFTAPVLSGAQTTVTYSSSNTEIATVDASTGEVTPVAAGTCTITATAAESEVYKQGTASYQLTVTSGLLTSVKAIKEAIDNSDKTPFTASLTDAIVVCASTAYPYDTYIEDAEAGMYLYNVQGLEVGQKINGTVSGEGVRYNAATLEVTKFDISEATVTTGAELPLTTVTIADYNADPAKYEYRRVKIEGADVSVAMTGSAKQTGEIKQGDDAVKTYSKAAGINLSVGDNIDVIGFPIYYLSSGNVINQIALWSADDITVKGGQGVITLGTTSKTLTVGETFTLEASVNSGATISFVSSDPTVATVDASTGEITAIAAGTATITASAPATAIFTAAEATCNITVVSTAINSYVLDNDAIKDAHTESWGYTSGTKEVTATDGSVWTLYNTYASKNQVTIQMNKGKGCYILSPEVSTGIKSITMICNSNKEGTGTAAVTRTFDIADGEDTVLLTAITGDALGEGIAIAEAPKQVKIYPNETTGGACYILSVTISY